MAINTPVLARNVTGQGNSKKTGKKRKWEERSGGILAATAAAIGNTQEGVPIPQSPQWLDKLLKDNPDLRILQRLTVIFTDVIELQNAVSHNSFVNHYFIMYLKLNLTKYRAF